MAAWRSPELARAYAMLAGLATIWVVSRLTARRCPPLALADGHPEPAARP